MLGFWTRRMYGKLFGETPVPTAISKLREWTSKFSAANIAEPHTSAGLIIAFVLGRKTVSICLVFVASHCVEAFF